MANDVAMALIPRPKRAATTGGYVVLAANTLPFYRIEVKCSTGEARSALDRIAKELASASATDARTAAGEYAIALALDPTMTDAESYSLRVTKFGTSINGGSPAGLFYGAVTFCALVEAWEYETRVPCCEIDDSPSLKTRGLFAENRYGTDGMTKRDWFSAVDYMADMKLNELTVGVYGCWTRQYDQKVSEYLYVPLKALSKLRTPHSVKYYSTAREEWVYEPEALPPMFEEDFFGELIDYAASRNIKVKPLFQSFGHNTLLPRMYPEISAKDESGADTGHGLCTSSDATYDKLFAVYDELIERYLRPCGITAIAVGLDEVSTENGTDERDPFKSHDPFCRCEKCRASGKKELFLEHIARIASHLRERGMTSVSVYQDMLFNELGVGYEELFNFLRERGLEKIVVIDWWNYAEGEELFGGRELSPLFRSTIKPFAGYYHWTIPTEHLANIEGCAFLAYQYGFDGIEAYGSLDRSDDRNFRWIAENAWNADARRSDFLARYAEYGWPDDPKDARAALDELSAATAAKGNEILGMNVYWYTYVNQQKPYPRRFPGEWFEAVADGAERFGGYAEQVLRAAESAEEFFESYGSESPGGELNDYWLLTAKQYASAANELLTLLDLDGAVMDDAFDEAIGGLLVDREELMRMIERIKPHSQAVPLLRNMTIYRELWRDILDRPEEFDGRPFDLRKSDGMFRATVRFLM